MSDEIVGILHPNDITGDNFFKSQSNFVSLEFGGIPICEFGSEKKLAESDNIDVTDRPSKCQTHSIGPGLGRYSELATSSNVDIKKL